MIYHRMKIPERMPHIHGWMTYSAYKLNKQGDLAYSFLNLESVCCSLSAYYCCFITCIQMFWDVDQVVWYSHLFKKFSSLFQTPVKGFSIVNEAELDVFHQKCQDHSMKTVFSTKHSGSIYKKKQLKKDQRSKHNT